MTEEELSLLERKRRLAREATRRWRERHPEASKASSRKSVSKWRNANPEKALRVVKEYQAKNYDVVRSKQRENYWRKVDLKRAQKREYQKQNMPKIMAWISKRRAAKLDATDPTHDKKIERVLHSQRARLDKCIGIRWSVDHILPLIAGGKHHHCNLQLLPAYWNTRKKGRADYPLPDCFKAPNLE
jgi:hypothetical protein